MSVIWNNIADLANEIERKFVGSGNKIEGVQEKYSWYNNIYTSEKYRRAHIEIVDKRSTHKMYILHCTIFPHVNDPSPIWGFDAVCGQNKITGAFHDFSLTNNHDISMFNWFDNKTKELSWNKPRQLPEWARQIFSHAMIAAGNLQDITEIDQLKHIALESLTYYLDNVGKISQENYKDGQNRYCFFQKQNPHVVNSMVAMGIDKEEMLKFVEETLFPEI
jgi:hypothetical protein